MKKTLALMLSVVAMMASAAAYNITGTVADTSGEGLAFAAVRLLSPKDSTMLNNAMSDDSGRFTVKDVKKGRYLLEASYVGYNTAYVDVEVKGAGVALDTIYLHTNAEVLDVVTVTGIKTPIKVMQDTIEYNADSYRTQPNAVVEDLLKRLPGVEVDADGKITANGKQVTKILVDGQEFFADDPKVASKNLPVNMVDKLQVVDRKSDLARLTGVDDGEEETVINLTVKKGMKNGWFGTVEGGYGTDERYKASFNVNRFWDGNQVTFIGGANNVNDLSFTDGGSRFRRFGGGSGITTSQAFGINFNVGNEEIFRIGGDAMYSHTRTVSQTRSTKEYLLSQGSRFEDREKNSLDRGHNIRTDVRLQWKPDSFNTLDVRPRFSLNINDSRSDQYTGISQGAQGTFTNQSWNYQKSHGNSFELGTQVIYNHNFRSRRGRSFSLQGGFNTTNMHENDNALNLVKYYLSDGEDYDPYDYYTANHTWNSNVSGRVSWTEPLGDASKGNFIDISYSMQYRWNNADKLTYDRQLPDLDFEQLRLKYEDLPLWTLDLLPGDVQLDSLSNRFRNDYMNQDIRVGYKHVSKTHNLNVGLSLVPQMSRSIDLINANKSIPERHVLNFAPYMRYRYRISKTRSLNLDYNGRSSQPSMMQLQPVADYTDPLNVTQGNPDLAPSFSHNLRFRFQDFNMEEQRSIMVMAMANMTQNSIISKTTFGEGGGSFTTYENVNGIWSVNAFSMFSMPFRNKTFTFNNFLSFSYSHNVGYNQGQRNNSGNTGFSESFGLAWRPDNLELELRPEYRLQYTTNSLAAVSNNTVHSYGGSFNGTYYSPTGVVLSTNLRYSANSGYGAGYNRNEWIWNATLSYQMLRDRSLTLSVSGYDLLNQRSNIRRTVTGNYIQDAQYNTLGRYYMVSVSYKFNTFGKGGEPRGDFGPGFGDGRPPMGPPPGGGGGRPMGPPPGGF